MNSSYNQNLKNFDVSPRFSQRPHQTNHQKPKPRQSQPPLMTQYKDFTSQYTKPYKDQFSTQYHQSSKLNKNFDVKFQINQKMTSNFNNFSTQFPQKIYENKIDPQSKIFQQTSPKNQSYNWHEHKYNNSNKNLPVNLSSNTQIINSSIHQKKTVPKSEIYEYKPSNTLQTPSSAKKDIYNSKPQISNNFTYIKKPTLAQQSARGGVQSGTKKLPRFSEPGPFNFNLQQQTKNIGDDRHNFLHMQNKSNFQQDASMRSYHTSSQNASTKYTSKYSTGSNGSQTKTKQNQTAFIKIDFLKKQKELKQTVSTHSSYNSIKNRFKMQQKIQFKIADFQKGKQLGSGKFGSVFVVKHKKTGFICAMKSIPKQIIRQENIVNQFIRQIKIQTYLDHPNITKLYGFFDDKDFIYLLLELSSEGQLYELLKQKKRLTQKTVIYLIKQLCQAIKYLHTQNIIHRDIKPENIVMQYGTIKLCDFGWAVCRGGELRSTFCGTPLYVSPQILKGQMYDQKIDIWSIGILTFELLTGEIPFQITTEQELIKIIKQDIVFPKNIDISAESKDFVLKILKKNPDERLKIGKLLEHPFMQQQVEITQIQL